MTSENKIELPVEVPPGVGEALRAAAVRAGLTPEEFTGRMIEQCLADEAEQTSPARNQN